MFYDVVKDDIRVEIDTDRIGFEGCSDSIVFEDRVNKAV